MMLKIVGFGGEMSINLDFFSLVVTLFCLQSIVTLGFFSLPSYFILISISLFFL